MVYVVSKVGIIGLILFMVCDLVLFGIRVNSIVLGVMGILLFMVML